MLWVMSPSDILEYFPKRIYYMYAYTCGCGKGLSQLEKGMVHCGYRGHEHSIQSQVILTITKKVCSTAAKIVLQAFPLKQSKSPWTNKPMGFGWLDQWRVYLDVTIYIYVHFFNVWQFKIVSKTVTERWTQTKIYFIVDATVYWNYERKCEK